MQKENTTCKKCGDCCKKGGPALHSEDLESIRSGRLSVRSLITIRKGELAYNPLTGMVQPVKHELIKIVGTRGEWSCCFFDELRGCTIYDFRPQACRILECWDTAEIEKLVGTDTLSRYDILPSDHPLVPVIQRYDTVCSCEGLELIRENYRLLSRAEKDAIESKVNEDLVFRSKVIGEFDLDLQEELFYFGRPFFQLLQPLGVSVKEIGGKLQLIW